MEAESFSPFGSSRQGRYFIPTLLAILVFPERRISILRSLIVEGA